VFGFQYEADGRAFLAALREQVEANELRLHPTKTRLLEFGDTHHRANPAWFSHICGASFVFFVPSW